MEGRSSVKAIIVIELDVNDHPNVAATEIATAIHAIRGVKTEHMTNAIMVGLDDVAESVVEYMKEGDRRGD